MRDIFARPHRKATLMPETQRGRFPPSPAPHFAMPNPVPFIGQWRWNAPHKAITRDLSGPLYQHDNAAQAALNQLLSLPHCLRLPLLQRYEFLLREKGLKHARHFLKNVFILRLWPRIQKVQMRNGLQRHHSLRFTAEEETYNRLPDLNEKELTRLAWHIATQCHEAYEHLCEKQLMQPDKSPDMLLSDRTQNHFYAAVAGMVRALNITPLFWSRFSKGRLDASAAVASLS